MLYIKHVVCSHFRLGLCFISTWSCPFGKAVPELLYLFSSSQSLRSFVLFGCVGHVHAFSPALGTSVHREPVLSVWHCDTLFPVLSLAFPWCSFVLTSLLWWFSSVVPHSSNHCLVNFIFTFSLCPSIHPSYLSYNEAPRTEHHEPCMIWSVQRTLYMFLFRKMNPHLVLSRELFSGFSPIAVSAVWLTR